MFKFRCSELWGVDIHPGAKLGRGLMLDHGTGIVIGETCVVGKYCSLLHNVTLGSSGKETGDRHPIIGDNVLIGCNAMVLGRITIGNSVKIGSGSVVIKPLPDKVTAVGNPAKVVGQSTDPSSAASMDVALNNVVDQSGNVYNTTWALWDHDNFVFEDFDVGGKGKINIEDMKQMMRLKFRVSPSETCMNLLFRAFDQDNDGFITKAEFTSVTSQLASLLEQEKQRQQMEQKMRLLKVSGGDNTVSASEREQIDNDELSSNKPRDTNLIILEYLQKISANVTSDGGFI
jgi:carbonic anhydrase/acetyltransferase-like protein (isoleucine patch superfamily)